MDPLSALGIAASVVQFVQFGGSLVSKSRQIYANGALLDHVECESATKRLTELTRHVKSSLEDLESSRAPTSDTQALKVICSNCLSLSRELLARLDELQVDQSKPRRWKSFRQALKSVSSKSCIDGLAGRLASCRDELNSTLIVSVRDKADALALRQEAAIGALNVATERTIETVFETRNELQEGLLRHSNSIIESSDENHAQTRASILHALGQKHTIEIMILRSLRFSTMGYRHVEISEAHRKTFRWIFDECSHADQRWSPLVAWLKHETGIYWINGKAGSGKSTLMRYIFDHDQTTEYLQTWANGSYIEKAGFFFWNSGTLEQRSQTGLFRSLLHQALHKRPDLVRHIFPDEWAESSSELDQLGYLTPLNWPLKTLKASFKRWIDLASTSSKLCFFIDGLDEYEGDHEEIVEFFKKISLSSSNVKFCLSSRPWIIFDNALRNFPGLRLQDLTYPDIEAYAADELQVHHGIQVLAQAQPEHALELVNEIVTKASGVFLWVIIVVRSLLSGLRNQDDIDDLRRRLQQLPSDLSSLYTHMLNHVEPLYIQQASRSFQIYQTLCHGHSTITSPDNPVVTALELDLIITANSQNIMTTVWEPMDEVEIRSRCEHLDLHLKSRCAGLLEIHEPTLKQLSSRADRAGSYLKGRGPSEPLARVSYLHRTVRDFLETDDIRLMLEKTVGAEFNSNLSIAMSYVIRMKRSLFFTDWRVPPTNADIWLSIIMAMKYAKAVDATNKTGYLTILDELSHAGLLMWDTNSDPWKNYLVPLFYRNPGEHWATCDKSRTWKRNLLGQAAAHGLCSYVEPKLKSATTSLLDQQETPLLFYCLLPQLDAPSYNPSGRHYCPSAPVNMIQLLLIRGADPNQLWFGNSPWQIFLTWVHGLDMSVRLRPTDDDYNKLHSTALIFRLLLQNRASPFTTCTHNHEIGHQGNSIVLDKSKPHNVSAVITHAFNEYFPLEAAELHGIVAERTRLTTSVSSVHTLIPRTLRGPSRIK